MRFQDRRENDMTSNQLTVVIVENIPVEEGPKVPIIPDIPGDKVTLEKGYYHGVHVVLHFHKEGGFYRKEEQVDMDPDPDEQDKEDVKLDDKRERHWMMVFEDNGGGLDNQKAIIHAKKWDEYMNQKEAIIKCGYYVEVSGSDRKEIIWEVIDDHYLEEGKYHDDMGIRGFGFNLFEEYKEGFFR